MATRVFLRTAAARARRRQILTNGASLIAQINILLAARNCAQPAAGPQAPLEPLSSTETRIMRYLPTNLKATEIATELYLSANTVRTHLRHIYAKLDAHSRSEAVARARELGLLAPAGRR